MSLRSSEMVKRWKERHRSHSGTSTLTEHPGPTSRPTTATAVDSWTDYNNNALPKVVEAAVMAAFSSGAFQDALTSMIEPALSKQQDKLNQLKLAHLNLESTVQTRLDEFPLLLKPAIDHMTSLKVPNYEKELEKLATGQEGLLEAFDERMENVENQLSGFDSRLKSLEDKVVNADLRSALRFGELSNELQDRNTTLTDRLWELEREVGGKLDGQQRRVVSLGEDMNKGIRRIQEKISDLESTQSGEHDGKSPSNSELLEKLEKMTKSLSKLDSFESGLRRDIHAVSNKVSSLDTSALESYPRKLEAIERTMSNLKSELETQGTLASLDSKLLSTNNARLEAVTSKLTKLGHVLDSVKEEVFDSELAQSHAEKLASVDSKMVEVIASVGAVQKHVSSLDTSTLATHSTHLGDLASGITRLENHLKTVDATSLSSQSDTLAKIKSTISELQTNISGKLSSQDESFTAINDRLASLPESTKIDSILSSLENSSIATSNGHESLSISLAKILEMASTTQNAVSSHSTMLATTSQTLAALHTETHDALKPLSSNLKNISTRIGSENDTLITVDKCLSSLASKLDSQHAELVEIKTNTGFSDILLAVSTAETGREKVLSTITEGIQDVQESIQKMHSSTMSEIRHKDASILAEVQKANTSHVEQATWFADAKSSAAAHTKALEDGFANLGAIGRESQTLVDSISSAFDATRETISEHHATLKQVLDLNQKHSDDLSELSADTNKLLEGHERSLALAETHSSSIGSLHDSVSKKEEIDALSTHLGSIVKILEDHSATLAATSSKDSIATLLKQLGESHGFVASNSDAVQAKLTELKGLLETNESLGKEIKADNTKVYETITNVLEEVGSGKSFIEKHASTTATGAAVLLAEMRTLKTMIEASDVSMECSVITNELSEVKGLTKGVQEQVKTVDALLQPKLKSIMDAGHNNIASLDVIRSLLETVKEGSQSSPVLESVASLRSLVKDQNTASLSPEILQMTKAIEEKLDAHAKSIGDVQSNLEAVKEAAAVAVVLTEIGALKETATSNTSSLRTLHDSLTTVGENFKDHEGIISKTIEGLQASIHKEGASRHSENESLASNVKNLESSLANSTSSLQDGVKAVDDLVRASGEKIETSLSTISNIDTTVSKTGVEVGSLLHEHLPKLSQDLQAINLKKLNTAAVSTEKALSSISTILDEISQLSKGSDSKASLLDERFTSTEKALSSISTTLGEFTQVSRGNDAKVSVLDEKISQASEITSYEITKVQHALKALDTVLTESVQQAIKNHTILDSHTTSLDTIKVDLLSNKTSTASSLSTIISEINTIAPAVRINSAAISRVDRAVLETGAQVKSVVLDGHSKLSKEVTKEIDALLSQLDESLHDSGTRIMGISDFDLPRLEEMVKGLEGVLERGLGGSVKANRRTRDALSVIGARVVGTQKKFDEMVEAHGEWEDGGNLKGMEGSGVLSVREGGRPEHRRLGSKSFRAPSNASSGKDVGGSLRGKMGRGESNYA